MPLPSWSTLHWLNAVMQCTPICALKVQWQLKELHAVHAEIFLPITFQLPIEILIL